MSQQRYVAPAVALCAALGVHSLIFLNVYQSNQSEAAKVSPMQIIILPEQAKSTAQTAMQQKKVETAPILTTHKKNNVIDHASVAKKSSVIAPQQQEKHPVNQQHNNTVEIVPIPHHVQQVILSHIQYPKQARRRGLQGKAEFKLNINSQSVKQVIMLASTGYAALDRAAKKGLINLNHLPLNDGSYSLAVVFRIQ